MFSRGDDNTTGSHDFDKVHILLLDGIIMLADYIILILHRNSPVVMAFLSIHLIGDNKLESTHSLYNVNNMLPLFLLTCQLSLDKFCCL